MMSSTHANVRERVSTDSWARRIETPVKVLLYASTSKRYRVRYLENSVRRRAGEVALVPKYAVRFTDRAVGTEAVLEKSRRARERQRGPVMIYCFNNLAGCVAQWRSRETGTLVGLYHSLQAGMDSDPECRWSVVCEEHCTLVGHATLADARRTRSPLAFCDDCRAGYACRQTGAAREIGESE